MEEKVWSLKREGGIGGGDQIRDLREAAREEVEV
jgi:hypothetical protein